jgi:hypothetical protein
MKVSVVMTPGFFKLHSRGFQLTVFVIGQVCNSVHDWLILQRLAFIGEWVAVVGKVICEYGTLSKSLLIKQNFLLRLGVRCRKQFCLLWLPRAVDFKVSCSQIPHHAFEPTTLWLRVRRPNHSATMLQTTLHFLPFRSKTTSYLYHPSKSRWYWGQHNP